MTTLLHISNLTSLLSLGQMIGAVAVSSDYSDSETSYENDFLATKYEKMKRLSESRLDRLPVLGRSLSETYRMVSQSVPEEETQTSETYGISQSVPGEAFPTLVDVIYPRFRTFDPILGSSAPLVSDESSTSLQNLQQLVQKTFPDVVATHKPIASPAAKQEDGLQIPRKETRKLLLRLGANDKAAAPVGGEHTSHGNFGRKYTENDRVPRKDGTRLLMINTFETVLKIVEMFKNPTADVAAEPAFSKENDKAEFFKTGNDAKFAAKKFARHLGKIVEKKIQQLKYGVNGYVSNQNHEDKVLIRRKESSSFSIAQLESPSVRLADTDLETEIILQIFTSPEQHRYTDFHPYTMKVKIITQNSPNVVNSEQMSAKITRYEISYDAGHDPSEAQTALRSSSNEHALPMGFTDFIGYGMTVCATEIALDSSTSDCIPSQNRSSFVSTKDRQSMARIDRLGRHHHNTRDIDSIDTTLLAVDSLLIPGFLKDMLKSANYENDLQQLAPWDRSGGGRGLIHTAYHIRHLIKEFVTNGQKRNEKIEIEMKTDNRGRREVEIWMQKGGETESHMIRVVRDPSVEVSEIWYLEHMITATWRDSSNRTVTIFLNGQVYSRFLAEALLPMVTSAMKSPLAGLSPSALIQLDSRHDASHDKDFYQTLAENWGLVNNKDKNSRKNVPEEYTAAMQTIPQHVPLAPPLTNVLGLLGMGEERSPRSEMYSNPSNKRSQTEKDGSKTDTEVSSDITGTDFGLVFAQNDFQYSDKETEDDCEVDKLSPDNEFSSNNEASSDNEEQAQVVETNSPVVPRRRVFARRSASQQQESAAQESEWSGREASPSRASITSPLSSPTVAIRSPDPSPASSTQITRITSPTRPVTPSKADLNGVRKQLFVNEGRNNSPNTFNDAGFTPNDSSGSTPNSAETGMNENGSRNIEEENTKDPEEEEEDTIVVETELVESKPADSNRADPAADPNGGATVVMEVTPSETTRVKTDVVEPTANALETNAVPAHDPESNAAETSATEKNKMEKELTEVAAFAAVTEETDGAAETEVPTEPTVEAETEVPTEPTIEAETGLAAGIDGETETETTSESPKKSESKKKSLVAKFLPAGIATLGAGVMAGISGLVGFITGTSKKQSEPKSEASGNVISEDAVNDDNATTKGVHVLPSNNALFNYIDVEDHAHSDAQANGNRKPENASSAVTNFKSHTALPNAISGPPDSESKTIPGIIPRKQSRKPRAHPSRTWIFPVFVAPAFVIFFIVLFCAVRRSRGSMSAMDNLQNRHSNVGSNTNSNMTSHQTSSATVTSPTRSEVSAYPEISTEVTSTQCHVERLREDNLIEESEVQGEARISTPVTVAIKFPGQIVIRDPDGKVLVGSNCAGNDVSKATEDANPIHIQYRRPSPVYSRLSESCRVGSHKYGSHRHRGSDYAPIRSGTGIRGGTGRTTVRGYAFRTLDSWMTDGNLSSESQYRVTSEQMTSELCMSSPRGSQCPYRLSSPGFTMSYQGSQRLTSSIPESSIPDAIQDNAQDNDSTMSSEGSINAHNRDTLQLSLQRDTLSVCSELSGLNLDSVSELSDLKINPFDDNLETPCFRSVENSSLGNSSPGNSSPGNSPETQKAMESKLDLQGIGPGSTKTADGSSGNASRRLNSEDPWESELLVADASAHCDSPGSPHCDSPGSISSPSVTLSKMKFFIGGGNIHTEATR